MPSLLEPIKALIFDLDDTLYDCSGSLVHARRLKAAGVIAKALGCTAEEAYKLQKEKEPSLKDNLYEEIANYYSLPSTFMEDIYKAIKEVDVSNIKPFPGVVKTLKDLKERGLWLILVTAGQPLEQEEKVRLLGLRKLLDEVIVVERRNDSKRACFQDILDRYGLRAEEVLCVGDKMEDELKIAKTLGMPTALVQHGRHYESFVSSHRQKGVPDIYIKNVAELSRLLPARQPSQ